MEFVDLGNIVTVDLYMLVINSEAIIETTNAIMLTMINGFLHLNIKTSKFWLLRKSADFCEFNWFKFKNEHQKYLIYFEC